MEDDVEKFRCPECGYTGTLDDFDVIGADGPNLFCPKCHTEDPMEPVKE